MSSTIDFASRSFTVLTSSGSTLGVGNSSAWAPTKPRLEWIWLSLILAVMAWAPVLAAQSKLEPDTNAGDFSFKMPQGWVQMPAQPGSVATLTEAQSAPGTSTVIALGTYGLVQDLKTSFTKVWGTLQQQSHMQQQGDIASNRLPGGNDAMAVSATMVDQAGKQWKEMILLAQNGNRSELVLFATDDLRPEAYTSAYHGLVLFLASLRLTPPDAVPGATPANPNPLNGMGGAPAGPGLQSGGMGQTARTGVAPMNPNGGFAGIYRASAAQVPSAGALDFIDPASHTPNYAFLTIFPDGRVKRGLIQRGFDEYQDEAQFRHDIASGGNTASQWGLYRISGGQGTIVFADARLAGQQLVSGLRGEMWSLTVGQGIVQANGVIYTLLDGGNGLALQGTYKPAGDSSQPGIRFTADGQFVDEGILDSHSSMAVGVVGGGLAMGYGFNSPHAGRGTYRISNYGLRMNYSNGQAPTTLFFIEAGADRGAPQALYIDDVEYRRVQ